MGFWPRPLPVFLVGLCVPPFYAIYYRNSCPQPSTRIVPARHPVRRWTECTPVSRPGRASETRSAAPNYRSIVHRPPWPGHADITWFACSSWVWVNDLLGPLPGTCCCLLVTWTLWCPWANIGRVCAELGAADQQLDQPQERPGDGDIGRASAGRWGAGVILDGRWLAFHHLRVGAGETGAVVTESPIPSSWSCRITKLSGPGPQDMGLR